MLHAEPEAARMNRQRPLHRAPRRRRPGPDRRPAPGAHPAPPARPRPDRPPGTTPGRPHRCFRSRPGSQLLWREALAERPDLPSHPAAVAMRWLWRTVARRLRRDSLDPADRRTGARELAPVARTRRQRRRPSRVGRSRATNRRSLPGRAPSNGRLQRTWCLRRRRPRAPRRRTRRTAGGPVRRSCSWDFAG